MKTYWLSTMREGWRALCNHHVETQQNTNDLVKGSSLCLNIASPEIRVLDRGSNPFNALFFSILALSGNDGKTDAIKLFSEESATMRNSLGRYGYALGNRIRHSWGTDQFEVAEESLRTGGRHTPIVIFDPESDHSEEHRCATLSASFSMHGERLSLLLMLESIPMHPDVALQEIYTWSMFQEMLAMTCGFRIGTMQIVSSNTLSLVSDMGPISEDSQLGMESAAPNESLCGDSDVEDMWYDLKAWPNIGPAMGYRTRFFKGTVLPAWAAYVYLTNQNQEPDVCKDMCLQRLGQVRDRGTAENMIRWVNECWGA